MCIELPYLYKVTKHILLCDLLHLVFIHVHVYVHHVHVAKVRSTHACAYTLMCQYILLHCSQFSICGHAMPSCFTAGTCSSSQFRCAWYSQCIPKFSACNGVRDCALYYSYYSGDISDENGCRNACKGQETSFQAYIMYLVCILCTLYVFVHFICLSTPRTICAYIIMYTFT